MLLPFQGDDFWKNNSPGRCPGLLAYWAFSPIKLLFVKKSRYPPKLSYMIDSGSTPSESSIDTTAFDMGPGPHM